MPRLSTIFHNFDGILSGGQEETDRKLNKELKALLDRKVITKTLYNNLRVSNGCSKPAFFSTDYRSYTRPMFRFDQSRRTRATLFATRRNASHNFSLLFRKSSHVENSSRNSWCLFYFLPVFSVFFVTHAIRTCTPCAIENTRNNHEIIPVVKYFWAFDFSPAFEVATNMRSQPPLHFRLLAGLP